MSVGPFVATLEADFDRDGTYEFDLTPYTPPETSYRISRGASPDGRMRKSQIAVTLRNADGTFTEGNSASALWGRQWEQTPIRITLTHPGGTDTLWTGYIEEHENQWSMGSEGARARTSVKAVDLAAYIDNYRALNVTVANRRTDEALAAIFAAMGLTDADYELATGRQSLEYHFARQQPAMGAIIDVLNSEMGGHGFIGADGQFHFHARDTRLGVSGAHDWGDGTNVRPRRKWLRGAPEDLLSIVGVQPTIRSLGQADTEIFAFSRGMRTRPTADSIYIGPGETFGPFQFDYAAPIVALTAPVARVDYLANTAANGSGTDMTSSLVPDVTDEGAGFSGTLRNSHASTGLYVTLFRLRGQPVPFVGDRPVFEFGKSIANAKTDRSLTLQVPFASDAGNTARDYALQLLRTYRVPYQRLVLEFQWNHNDVAEEMCWAEIGGLVRFADTAVHVSQSAELDDWYRIEAIEHDFRPGALPVSVVSLLPSHLNRDLDHIAYDLFTRDNAVGSLGLSTSGHDWSGDTGMDIASNKARPNTTAFQLPIVGDISADVAVAVDLANLAEDVNAIAGVQYRRQNGNNYWRCWVTPATNTVHLQKVVAGVTTTVAQEVYA